MITVSAVIVTYNGGEKVLRCIEATKAQSRPFDEVIVVDNASQDDSPRLIRAAHPDVRLIEMPDNRGPSVSRNAGLAASGCDFVFWIDNDLYPESTCLARLLDALAADPVAVVLPRIILVPDTHIVQADGGAAHFIGTLTLRHGFTPLAQIADHRPVRVRAFPSGCVLMERKAALAVGGFDESYFFYFEDFEFSFRSSIFGIKMVSDPAAIVYHDLGAGKSGLAFRGSGPYPRQRAYLLSRNRLRTVLTHFSLRTLIVLAPALLIYEFVGLGLAVMRGWTGAWWESWAWIVAHRAEIRERRRWVQARRRTPDREILSGGPLPLAPGLLNSQLLRWVAAAISGTLNAYWYLAKRLI